MPNPDLKNPAITEEKTKIPDKTTGGTGDSAGLEFGLLDKLSLGAIFKIDILDLIKSINPLSAVIPNFGGNKDSGLKKTAEDIIFKMLYSLACSICCSCLPFFLILLIILLTTSWITDILNVIGVL